nr:hypothetical protein [Malacoplasma sp.]
MFITEIVLKNIRSFTNEVKIDLNHNKKNIEQDLKEKKLFLRKNDVVYTPIVAIGGANAKGKTSTLESIFFVFDYFNYSTDDINLVINIFKSLGFSNLFLDSKFTNIISDYSKNTLINYFLKLPFDNDIEFFVKEIKKWLYDKGLKQTSKVLIKKILENFYDTKKNVLREKWKSLKSHLECSSYIEIKMYDESLGFFRIKISDFYLNKNLSDIDISIFSESRKNKINLEKILEKLFKYSNNLNFYSSDFDYFVTSDFKIFDTLNYLLKMIGKETTLKLIQLCDDSIKDII